MNNTNPICYVCQNPIHPLYERINIWYCSKCRLGHQVPHPPAEALTQLYQKGYYNSWGENEGQEPYWNLKKALYRKLMIPANQTKCPKNGLDVGCATGAGLSVLHDYGFRAFGIDINPYAVLSAQQKHPSAMVLHSTLTDVDFENSSFDIIILSDVLEHLHDPCAALVKTHALLKPGGYISILTPDLKSVSAKLLKSHWLHFKTEHLFYFSRESLEKMLQNCGFRRIMAKHITKPINLSYLSHQFKNYPRPGLTVLAQAIQEWIPQRIAAGTLFQLPMGEMVVQAVKP